MNGGIGLEGLTVGYRTGRRETRVIGPVDGAAVRGELTVLVGPNGAGKSTLLRTLAGLQPALSGRVLLDGEPLASMSPGERARRLAIVLTERVEVGLLSAAELVALGRHPHTGATGALRDHDRAIVADALAAVDASHLGHRRVAELSDGERQRVLTARALAQQPGVLLLDEPSAFLDVSARVALLGMLRRLAREQDLCVLVSTHDLELGLRLADRVWMVDRTRALRCACPEDLVADGTVGEVFDTPELAFDAGSGTFALRPPDSGTALVAGEGRRHAVLRRALARQGWAPVTRGPADVEVATEGTGFSCWSAGTRHRAADWDALAGWARASRAAVAARQKRADHADVRAALHAGTSVGAYFAVETEPQPPEDGAGWHHLRTLYAPDGEGGTVLSELLATVADRLGTTESRVAASITFQRFVARMASPLLAGLARGVLPDLDADHTWVQSRFGEALGVRVDVTRGWQVPANVPAEQAAELLFDVLVTGHARPMAAAVRSVTPVAERLLWGCTTSALAGALRVLEGHLGPVATTRVRDAVDALMGMAPLAGTGRLTPPGTSPSFERRTCCLYYRTPGGGHCADCALRPTRGGNPGRRTPVRAEPDLERRTADRRGAR